MSLFSTHVERDELGGGRFRDTIAMRRIAHYHQGSLRRNVDDWAAGDAEFPHVILGSSMLAYWQNAAIRLCPTRDPDVFLSFGRPLIKPAASWQNMPLAAPTRSGNTVKSINGSYDVSCVMGGFKVDAWDMEFKNGWQPPNSQIAFRVDLNGMDRQGRNLLVGGQPVMHWRAPFVYDAADPLAPHLPVESDFVQRSGDWYNVLTLPDLSGMARPCLDPTLTLQPDATDGVDTYIKSEQNTLNFETATTLFVGLISGSLAKRTGLLKFTLTGVPSDVTVSSSTLSVWTASSPGANNTVRLFSILAANNSWTEAGATWDHQVENTVNWAGDAGGDHGADAGCSVSGTDYNATQLGAFSVTSGEAVGTQHDVALLATQVQGWLSANYGMVLNTVTETGGSYQLASSDHATAAYRPKLVVVYSLPSAGGIFQSGIFHGGTFGGSVR